MELTDQNIKDALEALRKSVPVVEPAFIVAPPHWYIDRDTYKGRGRPRKCDYKFWDFEALIRDYKGNGPV